VLLPDSVPGLAYLTGLADATWTAIGLALGTYLNWLIVAKKIRLYSHGYQAITLPDYFSKRFGDDKHKYQVQDQLLSMLRQQDL